MMQVTYSSGEFLRSVTDISTPPLDTFKLHDRITSLVSVAHPEYYALTPLLPLGAPGVP